MILITFIITLISHIHILGQYICCVNDFSDVTIKKQNACLNYLLYTLCMIRMSLNLFQNSDLLGLMIEAGDGDSNRALSDGEIIAESVGFLVAGYETTSSALTFTTGLLASHPDIQEKLAEEIRKYFSKNPVCQQYRPYRYSYV